VAGVLCVLHLNCLNSEVKLFIVVEVIHHGAHSLEAWGLEDLVVTLGQGLIQVNVVEEALPRVGAALPWSIVKAFYNFIILTNLSLRFISLAL